VRIKNITRAALAAGLVVAAVGISSPDAGADLNATDNGDQLVECSGSELIATLNPTIKDGTTVDGHVARYIKAATKRSDGTKTFLSIPIPADTMSCSVDAGIRTNQTSQDVKYVLDNQSNGHATLTMGATGKVAASLSGSSQCDSSQAGPLNEYPVGYPLQGKLIFKFAELNEKGAQIQIQSYVRTYSDDADPGVFHVTGTVIKGPGLGGRATTAFTFLPTDSTKNVNVVTGCTNGTAGDAAGAELWVTGTDSAADADAANETFTVTIGDDFAGENQS
jgi:hypothetical protein